MARSIQYLMTYDKDWMRENLIQVEVADNAKLQLVLLDALRLLCPSGRAELLEKIKASAQNADVKTGVENFACQ